MSVSSFVNLRRMPTGRHSFSLQQMRERADVMGLNIIVEKIDRALVAARRTQQLELGYAKTKASTSIARGEAARIDNLIDEQIGAIYRLVEANRVGDKADPGVKAAQDILETLFPAGVGAITQLSFEEQLSTMDAMMEALGGRLLGQAQTLHLGRHLDRLERLIEEFRSELNMRKARNVTFAQVREARDELHEQMCKVVAAIIATLDEEDAQTVRQRDRLFAPLLFQQERVAEARKRQRQPLDVDPETGEELPGDVFEVEDLEPEPVVHD